MFTRKSYQRFVECGNLPWIARVGNIGAVLSYVAGGGRDLDYIKQLYLSIVFPNIPTYAAHPESCCTIA